MRYTAERLSQIRFPLGGIGSGCISLAGNGALVDFEVFNNPNKRSLNGYSGFAIRAERDGKVLDARVLQTDFPAPYMGEHLRNAPLHSGYGFGPSGKTLAGLRHFSGLEFIGEFPTATLRFQDDSFPGLVRMEATSPFIPLMHDDSSLPVAMFEITVENNSDEDVEYTLYSFLSNPFVAGVSQNRAVNGGVVLGCDEACALPKEDRGELCILSDAPGARTQTHWYRGGWCDGIEMFVRDLYASGPLKPRDYGAEPHPTGSLFDAATVAVQLALGKGASGKAKFLISWSFPLRGNTWNPASDGPKTLWKNHYATRFGGAFLSARYAMNEWDRLISGTRMFKEALHGSTLPEEAIDAISANLSVLRSPTVMRLPDGSLYGFEGCIEDTGCCEGSCTHVWNYQYALPMLFPALERSMRELDYRHNQREDGRMSFRLMLPLGRERMDFRACVDGQMGGVIKTYREFKLCGDVDWLRALWPSVKRSLEYAWAPTNEDQWDPAASGVITGRQHHTLDMELFGPNAWLQGFYLAALAAAAEMSDVLGEAEDAGRYRELFARGYAYTDQNLFQGEHFVQAADLADGSVLQRYRGQSEADDMMLDSYWNAEAGQLKYQIGQGCAIDQVVAGWHARLCSLPRVFDEAKEKSALRALYENNFVRMRDIDNTWRNYALNDERGLVICTWPEGASKPAVPLTYASECMTGFEYQAACHMILSGLVDEGLSVVRAVRDRYDGEKRNPWNEIECGSNYARSMASYSLLLALSGFSFDLYRGRIGFDPVFTDRPFRCFFSAGSGWGEVLIDRDRLELHVLHGELLLSRLGCPGVAREATIGGSGCSFCTEAKDIVFAQPVSIRPGSPLAVLLG